MASQLNSLMHKGGINMNNISKSAFAGLVATVPMTIYMTSLFKQLPAKEKSPLPPRKIAMKIAEEVDVKDKLSEKQKYALTMTGHYSYGAFASSLFFPLIKKFSVPKYVGGICYGLGVWAAGYLGWLPLTGLHKSATKMSFRRNALMITAHVVWGLSIEIMYNLMERRKSFNTFA